MTFKDTYIYIVLAIIAGIVAFTFCHGYYSDKNFLENLLVEANGLVMDFALIVILYEAYLKRRKDKKIEFILNRFNANIYKQTQSLIESLLKTKVIQDHWIKLIFDANNNEQSIFSYSLEYYELLFKKFECDGFKGIPQNETALLEKIITNYINNITDMLNYHIIEEDQLKELEQALNECREYLSRLQNPCAQRPVIRKLLDVLSVAFSKATPIKIGHRDVW